MQNIWHIIKIWARLFAWNMDSEILSLNRTLSFFSVVAIFTEKLPEKRPKVALKHLNYVSIRTHLPILYKGPYKISTIHHKRAKNVKKKQPKSFENGQKRPKIWGKWAKMWLKPLKYASMGTQRLKYMNWGSFST